MRPVSHIIIFIFANFMPMASAQAQSPREQLNQMVEQLQKAPTDNALREKIIKLAQTVKPAPAIPEEANRSFVRGNVFQKEAKDASGYELAISSYRDALRTAPWWGDAYYNLGVALELAQKFDEAIASIKQYMATLPTGGTEAREAQNRIYAIEAKDEMTAKQSQSAIVAQARRFEGEWHREERGGNGKRYQSRRHIKQGASDSWTILYSDTYWNEAPTPYGLDGRLTGSELQFKLDVAVGTTGGIKVICTKDDVRGTISADGYTLTLAITHNDVPRSAPDACDFYKSRSRSSSVEKYTKQIS